MRSSRFGSPPQPCLQCTNTVDELDSFGMQNHATLRDVRVPDTSHTTHHEVLGTTDAEPYKGTQKTNEPIFSTERYDELTVLSTQGHEVTLGGAPLCCCQESKFVGDSNCTEDNELTVTCQV